MELIKPQFWSLTNISPKFRAKVIFRFDMQPISKNPELYCWVEPDETESDIVTRFASKFEILENYYDFWKEKMIHVHKEHLINEENCIEDFCNIHGAWKVKPKPELLE